MPSITYQLFRKAIVDRKLIACAYRGRRRDVAPHIIGSKNRKEMALGFQFSGDSNSRLPPGGEWRCFSLGEVEAAELFEGPWRTGPSHRSTQVCIDIVDLDVNVST